MSTCYENEDIYFMYEDIAYCKGTKVTFSNDFIKTFRYRDKPIWPYASFYKKVKHGNKNMCFFTSIKTDWSKNDETCPYFLLEENLVDIAIEEITEPREITVLPLPKYKDWEVAEVMIGWIIYILVMFFSLILKEFYIAWFWATVVFFIFRKGMLNR